MLLLRLAAAMVRSLLLPRSTLLLENAALRHQLPRTPPGHQASTSPTIRSDPLGLTSRSITTPRRLTALSHLSKAELLPSPSSAACTTDTDAPLDWPSPVPSAPTLSGGCPLCTGPDRHRSAHHLCRSQAQTATLRSARVQVPFGGVQTISSDGAFGMDTLTGRGLRRLEFLYRARQRG